MSDPFDLETTAPSLTEQAEQAMNARTGKAALLDSLNPAQCEAVRAEENALLLLAGAGTGKTRVLTTRIAQHIAMGQAYPSQILAVTFTNKAAREMRERVGTMLGDVAQSLSWLGTFHSLSVRVLRKHAELVGLTPDFTILDADDQQRLIKQILQAEQIDEKKFPPRMIAAMIDRWKNRGLAPEEISIGERSGAASGVASQIYNIYQQRLKILNATDFGDLLMETVRLWRVHKDVLGEYHRKFKFILVDEYQDTNVVQYLWLRLLAMGGAHICCVGDDDQSIYGWRGAEIDNILRFEKDFSGAKIIRLEQNYRSSPHILAAASGLIAANEGRLGKTLWTERQEGDKVSLRGCWDGEEEARFIGDEIETYQRKKQPLDEIAILVRASFQMRAFEDRFITLGLPYRVIGGPRFYERAEIRDANAYLRLIHQPNDDLAFERICNKPRRGLGDVALQVLHQSARAQGCSLFTAALAPETSEAMKPAARRALQAFVLMVQRWQNLAGEMTHTELAQLVLDESGYTAMWQADKSPDAPGKLDNLKELVRAMGEFENLAGYLEHIALVMEAQNEESGEKISIMTLHAAKGLEFDIVFLPGWEEGLFPHQRSLDEEGTRGLEEERRLAYVGITRAKQKVNISYAGNRQMHGRWVSSVASRFINELPPEHVEVGEEAMQPQTQAAWGTAGNTIGRTIEGQTIERLEPQTTQARVSVGGYECGERVFHQKFGYGSIEEIDGDKLTIAFEKAGRKKVLENYVERH